MEVFAPNGVKIYNISIGKTIPEWISEKKKRKLKKNEGIQLNRKNSLTHLLFQ
jgi:ribosome biogenesis protein ENP2